MTKLTVVRVENVVESGLSVEEMQMLQEVDEMLLALQIKFGSLATLQDLNTGEVMGIEELARVRGILSMLANSRVFQLSMK